jgi:hypothetical protein
MADHDNPAISLGHSLWGFGTGWVFGIGYGVFVEPQVQACQDTTLDGTAFDPSNTALCSLIGGWTFNDVMIFAVILSVVAFLVGLIWITIANRERAPRAPAGPPSQPPAAGAA